MTVLRLFKKILLLKAWLLTLLALVLALSGCSSSPSIQEQEKIINYEKCLEFQIARWEAYQSAFRENTPYSFQYDKLEKATFSDIVFKCEFFFLP